MDEVRRRELLAETFEQLPILVAVSTGEDQRLAWMNAAGRELVGDRGLDAPVSEWEDWEEVAGPALVDRCLEVWRTGEPYSGTEWPMTTRESGGTRAKHYIDFTLSPVRWPDGTVRAVVGIGKDVTDQVHGRQRAAAHSQESERRYLEATELILQLQDALLPKGLPVPQGAQLAARYLLADAETAAGGDWFDAVVLGDGRLVVSVGDVVGHGVEASVTMGELRTVFDDRVRDDGDLVGALHALDRHARRMPSARGATVCAAVLDQDGDLTYCTAGHPPPVVVDRDGRAAYLPMSGATPLCAADGFATATRHIDPGEVVVLFSDGLVERPGRTPAQSTVDLLRVVEDAVREPGDGVELLEPAVDRICQQAIGLTTQIPGCIDDATVLAVQRVPAHAPLHLTLPAIPDAVRTARIDLDDWLAGLHVSALDELSLQHAIGELVTNAIEHAYGATDVRHHIRLRVELRHDGVIEAEIADDGRWLGATDDDVSRGRGLAMARGFTDELELDRTPTGTRVVVRQRPTRPAAMLRGLTTGGGTALRPFRLSVDGTTLRPAGDVDAEGAIRLRHAVERASRGGSCAVTIDLSEVSLLTSSGVQVLVDARSVGDVRLLAPMGSAAQHVLEMVRVPYDAGA